MFTRVITCPICLESFKDPVTITTCGHNFCRACLSCYYQGTERGGVGTPCPQCRKTFDHGQNIIPNRPLANVVQIAEKFRRAEEKNPPKVNLCEKYHQPVKISCQHQTVLHCAICGTTKPHDSNHGSSTVQTDNDVNKVSNIKFLLLWIRIASSPPPFPQGIVGKGRQCACSIKQRLNSQFPMKGIRSQLAAACDLAGEALKTRFYGNLFCSCLLLNRN
uniref:RING-type domain-containing protein n=1 Tax=Laticauda laticaudata TaxID=8630 RepID=A0A8C5SQ50_LATLA